MKLIRLNYASRLQQPLTKAQLHEILNTANTRNEACGITGFLCVSKRYALQCLEGSREEVNALYASIVKDTRHAGAEILLHSEPWHRMFAKWHMGFSNELSSAAPNSQRWHDEHGFNPFLVESDMIENVIEELSVRAERVELSSL